MRPQMVGGKGGARTLTPLGAGLRRPSAFQAARLSHSRIAPLFGGDGEGFEPTKRSSRFSAFRADALDHSATSPILYLERAPGFEPWT